VLCRNLAHEDQTVQSMPDVSPTKWRLTLITWRNAMRWDVLIIGAGQTGSPLAARLAESGRRVLLIERQHVGGTCVNYGCTPTKALVASARAAHMARTAQRLGVQTGDVTVDFGAVMARKQDLVKQWRSSVQVRLERAGDLLRVVHGHARFTGHRVVQVDGDTHEAETVVVNTGAHATEPPIKGLADVPWLDNARIMELDQVPGHLIVVGGGFIGCEFAQMFRRFGAGVTVIEPGPHLLSRADEEVSSTLEQVFRLEGISLRLENRISAVARTRTGVEVTLEGGDSIHGTHILVATGRTPNTADLGCEYAGIDLDEHGFVVIDDQYRTSADGVFATGDVTGDPQFTHVAWDDHRLLFDLLNGRGSPRRSGRLVPHVVYTDPQVAGVGLTEREAIDTGVKYELASLPFGSIARAIETGDRAGIVRILVNPSDERILGAAIAGAEAGELIHVVQALMLAGASARVLVEGQIAHPAFAEGVQSALMRLDRFALPDTGAG
jgi:pyruvate/2-oxoglutarate dehydrogenase complex dihydrolipoamide dehydrogenase (E3) component